MHISTIIKDELCLKRREVPKNRSDNKLDTNDIILNTSSDKSILKNIVDSIVSSPIRLYKKERGQNSNNSY